MEPKEGSLSLSLSLSFVSAVQKAAFFVVSCAPIPKVRYLVKCKLTYKSPRMNASVLKWSAILAAVLKIICLADNHQRIFFS